MSPTAAVFVDGVGRIGHRVIDGEPPTYRVPMLRPMEMAFSANDVIAPIRADVAIFRRLSTTLPDGRRIYAFDFKKDGYQVWEAISYTTVEMRADERAVAAERRHVTDTIIALESPGLGKAITLYDRTEREDDSGIERRVVMGVCRKRA